MISSVYVIEFIRNLIKKIRKAIPHSIIRTTLITGFPGETNEDFEILKEFIKEIRFNRLGVFAYSDEEGTKAYDFNNKVDNAIAEERKQQIIQIQQEISYSLNQKKLGKTYEVIIDNYDNIRKCYLSRSYAFAPDDADGYIYVSTDTPLEINLLGIRTGRFYPNPRFWQIAGEVGCPVTFGFDAHMPKDAYDGDSLNVAKWLVKRYKLNYIGMPKIIRLN